MDEPVFTTADYDWELFEDGSWKAWQDGRVVANGEFRPAELSVLYDELVHIDSRRVGMYDNDRLGEQ